MQADERFTSTFWRKVASPNAAGCRLWTAGRGGTGSRRPKAAIPGRFTPSRKTEGTYAYRIAWMLTRGEAVPPGLTIDHLCYEPLCCEPTHLAAVPQVENTLRANRHYRRPVKRTPVKRVGRRGKVTWKARFREYVDGSPVERSRTFPTREEAEAFLATRVTFDEVA